MGMEVTYDGPEGSLIAGAGAGAAKSVMFQQVSDYASCNSGSRFRKSSRRLRPRVNT